MNVGTGSGNATLIKTITVKVANGAGSGTLSVSHPVSATTTFAIEISASGRIIGKVDGSSLPSGYPGEIQGEASKDGLALSWGRERAWVPRMRE
jgi:hypothetical protein